MSSSDEVPQSVDPDFAALFRQAPPADLTHVDASGHAEPEPPADPRPPMPVAPAPEPRPAPPVDRAEPIADTGRLFRSQGVRGNDTAVLALSSDHGGRLRTLQRSDVEPPPVTPAAPTAAASASASFVPAAPAAAAGSAAGSTADAPSPERARRSRGRRAVPAAGSPGLTARACYLIIIGVTLLVAFVNALLASGDIGWPTGLALLAATVYCALKVRREDDLVPVITPPLAFFLTALTAAQLFLGSAERSLINRAVVVFFTLANNWIWIIGSTVVALVIMIVRRRRA